MGNFDSRFDPRYSNEAQLAAMVQLRVFQDEALYKRITGFLLLNSMMIVAYVSLLRGQMIWLACFVAVGGIVVNYFIRIFLVRQNEVLDYNINNLSRLWTINAHLEKSWGLYQKDLIWWKKWGHARHFFTKISPGGFILVWVIASGFAFNEKTCRLDYYIQKLYFDSLPTCSAITKSEVDVSNFLRDLDALIDNHTK